ncbi:MAG: hypothetical protein HRT88_08650 [Lentisphaeraceae bacterium]|nr:hypothetical protein [Lentisphaeraceae bacterium]
MNTRINRRRPANYSPYTTSEFTPNGATVIGKESRHVIAHYNTHSHGTGTGTIGILPGNGRISTAPSDAFDIA